MSLKTPRIRKSIDLRDAENHFKACYEISKKGINEIKMSEFNDLLNRTILAKDILVSKFEQLYPERNIDKPYSTKLHEEIKELFEEYYPSYKVDNKEYPNIIYRQCYFYLLRKHTSVTFKKMGDELGYDHSTVVHSKNIVLTEIELKNQSYLEVIECIESKLSEPLIKKELCSPTSC